MVASLVLRLEFVEFGVRIHKLPHLIQALIMLLYLHFLHVLLPKDFAADYVAFFVDFLVGEAVLVVAEEEVGVLHIQA